jgi:uncharacterized protein YkuJ
LTGANAGWRFAGSCADSQRFELEGINVWDCTWKWVPDAFVTIRDPHHNQAHDFQTVDLVSRQRTLRVLAGEFSNGIWGFYVSSSVAAD